MSKSVYEKSQSHQGQIEELLRLETFSAGVFAIAITMLILELVQILRYDMKTALFRLLVDHWKSLLAFLIGFLTILVCWINHQLVISYIERAHSKLFWTNGFVLLVVTLYAFSYSLSGGVFRKGEPSCNSLFWFQLCYDVCGCL